MGLTLTRKLNESVTMVLEDGQTIEVRVVHTGTQTKLKFKCPDEIRIYRTEVLDKAKRLQEEKCG